MGSTFQEIEINASADTVWQKIRNVQDASWAPNVVSQLQAVGDKAGATRGHEEQPGVTVRLTSGGALANECIDGNASGPHHTERIDVQFEQCVIMRQGITCDGLD